ncbi:hypothetical protein SARC_07457 [Sphaeroforma arctica JP610]|uniref:Uncharacterized protein n=1 Tax=Sphaeroforma arctica JP610 TaxID=667725 RepID=A0A0L0FW59_9EUKA|nr:hypothetical protein SARC_07457 [Sphaeroforma arctica JP610]KNC80178.1 hypothetical protein SARC_07457 [Sphaeroforma arctica JP610]|eukprot:XP_014154080.1 hypothetical protein SARC_07457 [Sphaeroforma arctica JP610]
MSVQRDESAQKEGREFYRGTAAVEDSWHVSVGGDVEASVDGVGGTCGTTAVSGESNSYQFVGNPYPDGIVKIMVQLYRATYRTTGELWVGTCVGNGSKEVKTGGDS